MIWNGCIEATTLRLPKRGMSACRRCCAFDTKTAVTRAIGLGRLFVNVEYRRVCLVADGVDVDLQSRFVGGEDEFGRFWNVFAGESG